MRIGLFLTPQFKPGADLQRGFSEILDQVRAAKANGFSSVFVGQHMVTGPEMQMLQTVPLMARLLPEMEGMQIGPGVLLLSMLNPVMTAEEGATIDWMSDGNYVLAAGLGYREEEFEAMGTRKTQRVSRLEESVDLVKRLWTEERVTHHGKHFNVSNVGCSVRPKQQPRPPIWLGGDVEAAVRRAARIADAWLGSPTADLNQLLRLLQVYTDERRSVGAAHTPCPIIRECFIGRDKAHVKQVSHGSLLYKYEAYASWGHNDTQGTSLADTFDDFCNDRFMLGDIGHVREDIQRYREQLSTDHIIVRTQWPGLEQSEVIGNIERIGQVLA